MIVATRIRSMTEHPRRATIRAAALRSEPNRDQHPIVELERRGYRVPGPERAA